MLLRYGGLGVVVINVPWYLEPPQVQEVFCGARYAGYRGGLLSLRILLRILQKILHQPG
jgi:hypothetical protein